MSWMQGNTQNYFSNNQDENFLKYLGDVFQFSLAGRTGTNNSKYSYFLLKPHPRPGQRFGLSGEILALYAPYAEIQARSIIDAQELQQTFKERVHPVWNILITDDPNTRENLDRLTAGKDLETYSIPFSRSELEAKPQAEFIYERLEQYIKGRDLFAFQSALQSDTFFFGRKGIVDRLIAQIENGQNFGLFGLRKTGKTSVLNAVERYLEKLGNYKVIRLDCQNPSIYLMRWNSLINRICADIEQKDI